MTLFCIFVNSVQTEFIQKHESLRGDPLMRWSMVEVPFSAAYREADSPAAVPLPRNYPRNYPERILALLKSIPKSLSVCLPIARSNKDMIMRSLTPRLHQQHTNGQSHVQTGVQAGVQVGVQAGVQAQEKTREKILVLIAANPSITMVKLANRLGITAKGVE